MLIGDERQQPESGPWENLVCYINNFHVLLPLINLGSVLLLFCWLINVVKIIPVSTLGFCKFYLLISLSRLPERLYHLIKERTNKRINVIYGMGTGDCKGSGEN